MIDEKKLIEELNYYISHTNEKHSEHYAYKRVKELIERQPKVDDWILCSEKKPEEHDSMFKKFKGTDKWRAGMFESISNEVNVTIQFKNGKRATTTGHTIEGKWSCEREYAFGTKVIAWQPLPETYRGD